MNIFKIIDISDFTILDEEVISAEGSSRKFWVNLPDEYDSTRALVKFSKENKACFNGIDGSHWSEKLGSEIGNVMRLETQKTDLAYQNGEYCVLCYCFTEKNESTLFHGSDILGWLTDDEYKQNLNEYTVENIFNKIEFFLKNKLNDTETAGAFEKIRIGFIEMMCFDFIIGNTDRHHRNWGIVKNSNGFHFSPIFDNASSLSRELDKGKILSLLSDKDNLKRYCLNHLYSQIRIESFKAKKKIKFSDIILELVKKDEYKIIIDDFIGRVDKNMELIFQTIELLNKNVIIDKHKELIKNILNFRFNWMKENV